MKKLYYAELNKESFLMVPKVISGMIKYRLFGIPKLEFDSGAEIAESVIKENSKDVLVAGKNHFSYMWTTDMSIAFIGAMKVLPHSFLRKQLQRILDTSFRLGYVPTCFSRRNCFNMPFKRQDNFPCLLHSLYHLHNNCIVDSGDEYREAHPDIFNCDKLKSLYRKYMIEYYDHDTSLLKNTATYDWMDTVRRPSSTFSNLFLLHALNLYEEMTGEKTPKKSCEKAIMEKRWSGDFFIDYENSAHYLCADANVPVLYFGLFKESTRRKIYDSIESSDLLYPVPMKTREGSYNDTYTSTLWARDYHSLIWPHLGLMYLNGLKQMGFPYEEHLERFDKTLSKHKNFLEVLNENGEPFLSRFFLTEHHFSMSAGQYLELVI